jgi:hypothetical protein
MRVLTVPAVTRLVAWVQRRRAAQFLFMRYYQHVLGRAGAMVLIG